MHPNRRRSPTATLQLIQRPAFAIIPARILLPRHLSMDLDHGIQHVLDVFEFGPGGETNAEIGAGVAGQHDAGARGVDFVAGVAHAADAGDIGCGGAAAVDGFGVVLPEPDGELEGHLEQSESLTML